MELVTATAREMASDHLEDLRAQARLARERYQLYKARTFGERPTSEERLRELSRTYEQAEARRRFAEAEEERAHGSDSEHPD
jgi:hypothetical protein